MIFEGTKNQFFFGLELTRAGDSVPDIEKCEKSERIRGNLYFKSQSQNPDKG